MSDYEHGSTACPECGHGTHVGACGVVDRDEASDGTLFGVRCDCKHSMSDGIGRIREWRDRRKASPPSSQPEHYEHVDRLLTEIDRLAPMETIVRDLAASNPECQPDGWAVYIGCRLCEADTEDWRRDPIVHTESCPWRRAKELLGE